MGKEQNRTTDRLGEILKHARLEQGLPREQLAERIGISTRYLTAIENENRKPKFDVLYRLVRCLGISADRIFYPEQKGEEGECARLIRLIKQCDVRDRKLITALVNEMIASS